MHSDWRLGMVAVLRCAYTQHLPERGGAVTPDTERSPSILPRSCCRCRSSSCCSSSARCSSSAERFRARDSSLSMRSTYTHTHTHTHARYTRSAHAPPYKYSPLSSSLNSSYICARPKPSSQPLDPPAPHSALEQLCLAHFGGRPLANGRACVSVTCRTKSLSSLPTALRTSRARAAYTIRRKRAPHQKTSTGMVRCKRPRQ